MEKNTSQLMPGDKLPLEYVRTKHEVQNVMESEATKQLQSSADIGLKSKNRRPDKALYVPRALRSQKTVSRHGTQEKINLCKEDENSSTTISVCNEGVLQNDCINLKSEDNLKTDFSQNLDSNNEEQNAKEISYVDNSKTSLHDKNPMPHSSLHSENSAIMMSLESVNLCDNNNFKILGINDNETVESGERSPHVEKKKDENHKYQCLNIDVAPLNILSTSNDAFNMSADSSLLQETITGNSNPEGSSIDFNCEFEGNQNKFIGGVSTVVDSAPENDIIPDKQCVMNNNSSTNFLIDQESYYDHSGYINGESSELETRSSFEKDTDFEKTVETNLDEKTVHSTKDDGWEASFTEDGECLNPEIEKQLCIPVDSNPQIKSQVSSQHQTTNISSNEEWSHIVEMFDFPAEFKTQDLVSAFSVFQKDSYSIKWVDDCHALGIFSSPFMAKEAVNLKHPFIKFRPLSQGTKESKLKAKLCASCNLPYKPRPATSATIARRLVSGALGLRVKMSKEQRESERKVLLEARERKRQKAKQKADIWDGVVS